jgi:hypothetical protein
MRPLVLFTVLLALLPIAASARLKPAALRLPEELAAAERLPVSGRQGWKLLERLEFGDVRVGSVERSLTKGSDLGILFYAGSRRRQSFGFTVHSGDGPSWRGAAATNLRRRALEADGLSLAFREKTGFSARLVPADRADGAWTLELTQRWDGPLAGTLRGAGREFVVRSSDRLAGTPLRLGEPAGYLVEDAGRAVAAAEVVGDGAVWLAPGLAAPDRAPVVAALASLLLFEELRPTLPE